MLNSLKIVEFEGLGPAPFAAMLLADLGAEVTVIQRPGPANPIMGETNLLDRGKRAVTLDLKNPDHLAAARALVNQSDALIEGLRPGVMERLGLGPDAFTKTNPKLVYARMTGWGQTGPRAHLSGHDYNYIATSGAYAYCGLPGTTPLAPPTLVGDIGGGSMYLVTGLLAGVLNARQTGKGCVVDAAITDGSAHMMALFMALVAGKTVSPLTPQNQIEVPPWGRAYACADGRFMTVQCLEPKFYALFVEKMGLADDPGFAAQYDRAQWPAQTARLAALFAAQPVHHWADLFANTDACAAPVLDPWQAAQDPHMMARQIWQGDGDTLQPAPAPRFDGQVPTPNPIPQRGEHTNKVLAQLREQGLI